MASSRLWICKLMVGWRRPSFSAAADRVPSSTTVMNVLSKFRFNMIDTSIPSMRTDLMARHDQAAGWRFRAGSDVHSPAVGLPPTLVETVVARLPRQSIQALTAASEYPSSKAFLFSSCIFGIRSSMTFRMFSLPKVFSIK